MNAPPSPDLCAPLFSESEVSELVQMAQATDMTLDQCLMYLVEYASLHSQDDFLDRKTILQLWRHTLSGKTSAILEMEAPIKEALMPDAEAFRDWKALIMYQVADLGSSRTLERLKQDSTQREFLTSRNTIWRNIQTAAYVQHSLSCGCYRRGVHDPAEWEPRALQFTSQTPEKIHWYEFREMLICGQMCS